MRRQQHFKLSQETLEKSEAGSNFINESVQNFLDFDEEADDWFNPEFVSRVTNANYSKLFSNLRKIPSDPLRLLNLACERTGVSLIDPVQRFLLRCYKAMALYALTPARM